MQIECFMLVGMNRQTQLPKLSDTPVYCSFREYLRLDAENKIRTIQNRDFMVVGNFLRPIRIAWQRH